MPNHLISSYQQRNKIKWFNVLLSALKLIKLRKAKPPFHKQHQVRVNSIPLNNDKVGSTLTSELSNLTGVGLRAGTIGSAADDEVVVGVSLCLTLSSASLSLTSTSSLHDKSMVLSENIYKK
mgnify:CR=1 FL=1